MGVTKEVSKEEAYKIVLDFMENLDYEERNLYYATFIQVAPKFRRVALDLVCHAEFKDDYNWLHQGSQLFETTENTNLHKKFWKWITHKDSPWYILSKHIEPTYNKTSGLQTGWMVDQDKIKDIPFYFVKNFAILTRVLTEKPNNFAFWEYAVDAGVDPRDAFVLCSYFSYKNNKIEYSGERGTNINGGHWPIQYLDIRRFTTSDPKLDKNDIWVNGCWQDRHQSFPFNKLEGLGVTRKTKFSSVAVLELSEILNKYYPLKKEYMK